MLTKITRHLPVVAGLAAFWLSPVNAVFAASAQHFGTEQAAKQHCGDDPVVWVNTKSGVYHLKGERWYGNTKAGAYECKQEADGEGDRMTRNGQ